MEWQAIQAVSELLAAAGVVASLLYVGVQMRQSNRLAQAAAYQEMGKDLSDFWRHLAADAEMADLIWRAHIETPSLELTDEQHRRSWAFWISALRLLEVSWRQIQLGLLDPAAFEYFGNNAPVFASDGAARSNFQKMWPEVRMELSPDFASFIAEAWRLETAPSAPQVARPGTA